MTQCGYGEADIPFYPSIKGRFLFVLIKQQLIDKKTIHGIQKTYQITHPFRIPIIIGQLGNIVTGLADTVMVGQHSTEELAAASFVNNVINAFIILGTGFSFNYTPIIGEHIAVNKRIAIGGWLKNSLMANLFYHNCHHSFS